MDTCKPWRRVAVLGACMPWALALTPRAALACPDCVVGNVARAAVFDAGFARTMALLTSPLMAIAAIAMVIHGTYRPSEVGGVHAEPVPRERREDHRRPLIAAGLVLGAGLGGFVDGIVLHQILQWHNMLSSRIAPVDLVTMKQNMVWDGLFHAFTWLMTACGIALLFRAARRPDVPWSARTLVGSLAIGWGLFNVIEGVIDHHILELHHVHPGSDQLAWDVAFLVFGAALLALGAALLRERSA